MKPWSSFSSLLTPSLITSTSLPAAYVQARSPQPRPALWGPVGASVRRILQARIWRGLPCPSPGDLPDPGIKPLSLRSPALEGELFTTSATWEAFWALIMPFTYTLQSSFLGYSMSLEEGTMSHLALYFLCLTQNSRI